MKAITIKQPWATLIVKGYKKYEFRTWKTKYRGELLIHAGKGIDKKYIKQMESLNLDFPNSKIIGKVNLVDCIELNEGINQKINNEFPLVYGEKSREGYAWRLEEPVEITSNKVVNGKLSLWDYNTEEL